MEAFDHILSKKYKLIYDDLNLGTNISTNLQNKEYADLLNWHNGQISTLSDLQLFAHGSFLSYEKSMELRLETIEIRDVDLKDNPDANKWFRDNLIPLTIDAGGDFLCVDEFDGKLYQFIHDDQVAYAGYASINEWLQAHLAVYEDGLVDIKGITVSFPDYLIKA
jgi:hypothetical protein